MFRKITIALICILAAAAAKAGNGPLLTFEEAVTLALERNPRIAVARNNALIAKNNVHIGNAGLLPRFDLSGSAAYQESDPPSGPTSDISSAGARLTASYTVFDGFSNIFRYRLLESEGKLGELEARAEIENVLTKVSAAYYGAAAAYENFDIANHLLEISRERYERTRKRAEFGQGGTVDVLAAEVDFNSDTVTVVQSRYAWDQAKRNLNTLLDRDLSTDFTVELDVAFSEIDSPEAIRETAMKENASYRTAVESLNQARISRNITRSAYVPELSFSASYGYDRIADELDFSLNDPTRNWDVRATLSFNIFNGFQRRIDSKNAALRVSSGELLEKQANLELESELANAHESYRNSLTVLRLEERNIESARVNFKRTSELYNLGQVTSTQFREAQLNLIKAETNVSTATFDAKLDEIELLRITGNLISETAPSGNRRGDNY